jgi:hypothetical protein
MPRIPALFQGKQTNSCSAVLDALQASFNNSISSARWPISTRSHILSMRSDKSNMRHMTEDALEQYVLRHLSEPEVDEIEKHVVSCGRCKQQLASTKAFIDALRDVKGMFEPASPSSARKPHHCKHPAPNSARLFILR